jgi:hypothetical protein
MSVVGRLKGLRIGTDIDNNKTPSRLVCPFIGSAASAASLFNHLETVNPVSLIQDEDNFHCDCPFGHAGSCSRSGQHPVHSAYRKAL